MVIVTLAIVPGESSSEAVTVIVPGPLAARNTEVKLPEAFVITARGTKKTRAGLLNEKLTTTPGVWIPFTNTWPEKNKVLFPWVDTHAVVWLEVKVIEAVPAGRLNPVGPVNPVLPVAPVVPVEPVGV